MAAKKAKDVVTKKLEVSLTGKAGDVERTLRLLEEILGQLESGTKPISPISGSRPQAAPIPAKETPADLKAIWTGLTPNQRELLKFVWQRESGGLTYEEISGNSLFFMSDPLKVRHMSDKSVRKCARDLFDKGLLARDGPRSSIHLTPLAHELVAWGKAHDKQRLSG